MMEINIVVLALISVSSVVVGWLLRGVSTFLQISRTKHKKLKYVLYNLLEIFYILDKMKNSSTIVDRITSKLLQIIPNISADQKELAKRFLNELFSGFVSAYLRPVLETDITQLQDKYEKSVDELARVDPILAYGLRGRLSRYRQSQDFISGYFQHTRNLLSPGESIDEAGLQRMKDIAQDRIVRELHKICAEDLKEISRRIGIFHWLRLLRLIRGIDKMYDREIDEYIERNMSDLSGLMKESQ